jgi:hypothetical protein
LKKKRTIDINENNRDDGDISVSQKNNSTLLSDPSPPLPLPPNTRANQKENADDNNKDGSLVGEISLDCTAEEWKNVFSRTNQKMKPDWTHRFYKILTSSSKIRCPVKFRTPYFKKGKRKNQCRFFCCYARCTISICKRKYQIILRTQPDDRSTVLFLVRIFGQENHNISVETSERQLRGENRFLVGKNFYYLL